MILSETSSRKPSRIGFWIVLGLGALLLPLAPRAAQTQAPDKPKVIETKDAPAISFTSEPSIFRLAENPHADKMHNCALCHQLPVQGHDFDDRPQSWKRSHDEIVRLLDEVRTRRKQLQEAEDRLKRALDTLNRLEARSQPAVKSTWNVTWAEALFEKRTLDLGSTKQGISMAGTFRMTNNGKHPVHISRVRTSVPVLKATASAHDLPPGGSALIVAQLFTDTLSGKQEFKVYVQFDKPDRQEVALELRANVQTPAPAKPQSPERLQQLEKKLDELRKEMETLRREMRPDKPPMPGLQPERPKR